MDRAPVPSIASLSGVFLRIGNLTFGGGVTTVSALQRELVSVRGWLTNAEYALCYALSRVTPGTNLFAFCTAGGWRLRRWRGAIAALLAASIPCCVFVALLTGAFDAVDSQPLVRAAVAGAMAASAGILVASFWLIAKPYLTRDNAMAERTENFAIVIVSIGLAFFTPLSPLAILAIAAGSGYFLKVRGAA